jgi:hypothetical protein
VLCGRVPGGFRGARGRGGLLSLALERPLLLNRYFALPLRDRLLSLFGGHGVLLSSRMGADEPEHLAAHRSPFRSASEERCAQFACAHQSFRYAFS